MGLLSGDSVVLMKCFVGKTHVVVKHGVVGKHRESLAWKRQLRLGTSDEGGLELCGGENCQKVGKLRSRGRGDVNRL